MKTRHTQKQRSEKTSQMRTRQTKESRAAEHEVAHAVMRKLCRLSATELAVDGLGGGFCEGSGERINENEALLVTLAGIAWETGCRFTLIDWEMVRHTFVDAGEAWKLVNDLPILRFRPKYVEETDSWEERFEDPNNALNRWFAEAGERLKPHRALIRRLGKILEDEGSLSAARVDSYLRAL